MKVHSHDEFSPLKSVILGTFSKESAALETQNPSASFTEARLLIQKAYPDWYIDEVNEDIESFRQALVKCGVEVYRPSWPFLRPILSRQTGLAKATIFIMLGIIILYLGKK